MTRSFTCHCGNTGEERTLNTSQHKKLTLEKKSPAAPAGIRTRNCCSEPVSYAAVEEDCTGGLIMEVINDSKKVGADVVLVHG